jgi:hypothetical protein
MPKASESYEHVRESTFEPLSSVSYPTCRCATGSKSHSAAQASCLPFDMPGLPSAMAPSETSSNLQAPENRQRAGQKSFAVRSMRGDGDCPRSQPPRWPPCGRAMRFGVRSLASRQRSPNGEAPAIAPHAPPQRNPRRVPRQPATPVVVTEQRHGGGPGMPPSRPVPPLPSQPNPSVSLTPRPLFCQHPDFTPLGSVQSAAAFTSKAVQWSCLHGACI